MTTSDDESGDGAGARRLRRVREAPRKKQATRRDAFVVRIWRETDRPDWRGWVQHARTGEAVTIQDVEGLLAFIERRTGKLTGPAQGGHS